MFDFTLNNQSVTNMNQDGAVRWAFSHDWQVCAVRTNTTATISIVGPEYWWSVRLHEAMVRWGHKGQEYLEGELCDLWAPMWREYLPQEFRTLVTWLEANIAVWEVVNQRDFHPRDFNPFEDWTPDWQNV